MSKRGVEEAATPEQQVSACLATASLNCELCLMQLPFTRFFSGLKRDLEGSFNDHDQDRSGQMLPEDVVRNGRRQ